jgi:hypothetical protein
MGLTKVFLEVKESYPYLCGVTKRQTKNTTVMYNNTENFYNAARLLVKAFAQNERNGLSTYELNEQVSDLVHYATHRKVANAQAVKRYYDEVVYAQKRGMMKSLVEFSKCMGHAANCVDDINHALELLSNPSYFGKNLLDAEGLSYDLISDLLLNKHVDVIRMATRFAEHH